MGSRKRSVPMGRMFSIQWGYISPDPRAPSMPPQMTGPARVQSELTDALRALAAGESLTLALPMGIASALGPDAKNFDAMREFFTSQGFDPVPFDLASGVPPPTSLVAFLGMGRKLLPNEASALAAYEKGGGRILILADPRKPESFPGVLDEYGVRLEATRVEDELRQTPRQPDPSLLLSNELCVGNHEIDRPLALRIGIAIGPCRSIAIEKLGAANAERTALLQASSAAVVVPVEFREQSGDPDFIRAARKSAPGATLAAALRRPADGGRESRVVVFGGWEIADPQKVSQGSFYGNRDLVLNSLNWLADRKQSIGIVEREFQATKVEMTPGFLNAYRWIAWGAFDLVLGIIAVLVWLARRN
jgi:hypothetical protein